MKNVRWYWLLAFLIVLAGFNFRQDALVFAYGLFVSLVIFRSFQSGQSDQPGQSSQNNLFIQNRYVLLRSFLLFFPFGLFPLIKGGLVWDIGMTLLFICVFFFVRRAFKPLIYSIVFPAISLIFFWKMSGQNVSDLPGYISSITSITFGYTQAMSLVGKLDQVIVFFVAAVIFLLFILFSNKNKKKMPLSSQALLFFSYALFLFLSFKEGFVRHDHHALAASVALMYASVSALFVFDGMSILIVSFVCIVASCWVSDQYRPFFSKRNPWEFSQHSYSILNVAPHKAAKTYGVVWKGLWNRMTKPGWMEKKYQADTLAIKHQAAFPELKGTVDLYPIDQALLLASGYQWSPRPIPLSYSAYTKKLARANRVFLESARAPDNIIFRVESIDGRLVTLADGSSWPELLTRYDISGRDAAYLFLKKISQDQGQNKSQAQKKYSEKILSQGIYKMGQTVPLPAIKKQLLFLRIDSELTFIGKLIDVLYKPSQLKITLFLDNGKEITKRFIPRMGNSPFLISPFVDSTDDFAALYQLAERDKLHHVKAIKLTIAKHGVFMWTKQYQLEVTSVSLT